MGRIEKVVSLASRRVGGADSAGRTVLLDHWHALAGADGVPFRDDIDPAEIASALDTVLLVERISPKQVRIRLAGRGLGNLLGMELRGMPLSCLVAPASREMLGETLEQVFDAPALARIALESARAPMLPKRKSTLSVLPLRVRSGEITRAICHLDLPHSSTSAPARFDVAGTTLTRIEAGIAWPRAEESPDALLGGADHARDVLRRRRALHVVS